MNEGTRCTLHGKNIVHITQGSNTLHFFYDASNKPAIVEYNGAKYAYVHNLQGDIVAILDSNSNKVVEYKYDAWGKPFTPTGSMATILGELNPFRYRRYVYDEETGLYYLRSRLYSVATCRFINADALINGNLYAYTANSPVRYCDADGYALCTAFADCGFGNPMASLTGGGGGGGSCGGFAAYDYAYRTQSDALPIGGTSASGKDPVEQFADELKEMNVLGKGIHLAMNVVGGTVTTKLILIGTASPSLTIKIACYAGAAIVGFSTEYVGTEVEEDLAPDNQIGGAKDNTNPDDSLKNGVAGAAVAFIPAKNILPRIMRWTIRPGLKWVLKLDENDEE